MDVNDPVHIVVEVPYAAGGTVQPILGLAGDVGEREFVLTAAWRADREMTLPGWSLSQSLGRHFVYVPFGEERHSWCAPPVPLRPLPSTVPDAEPMADQLELSLHRWANGRPPREVLSWFGVLRPTEHGGGHVLTLGKERRES